MKNSETGSRTMGILCFVLFFALFWLSNKAMELFFSFYFSSLSDTYSADIFQCLNKQILFMIIIFKLIHITNIILFSQIYFEILGIYNPRLIPVPDTTLPKKAFYFKFKILCRTLKQALSHYWSSNSFVLTSDNK